VTSASKAPRKRLPAVPVVHQLEQADCGAACLTMVLRYLGGDASSAHVRRAVGTSPFGVTAGMILQAGARFGLHGRVVRLAARAFEKLPRGAILHWEFSHFVVFDEVCREGARIVDPAAGRRVVATDVFLQSFTGLALLFEPSDELLRAPREHSVIGRFLSGIAGYRDLARRVLLSSLLVQVFGAILPAFTGVMIDRVIPHADEHLLVAVGVSALLALTFKTLAELARSYALIHFQAEFDRSATTGFVMHMLGLPYTFFQRRSEGDLMMRVNSHASLRDLLGVSGLSALIDGSLVAVYAVLMLLVSPAFAALTFVLGAAQVAAVLVARPHLSERVAEEFAARGKSQTHLAQTLAGVHTLKTMGAEPEALAGWSKHFVHQLNAATRLNVARAGLEAALSFLATLSPLAVLCLGAYLVLHREFSLGTMLALVALAGAFFRPLTELFRAALRILEARTHLRRVQDVLAEAPEPTGASTEPLRLRGELQIDNATFAYEGSAKATLSAVNLTIYPGQSLAIVGPSGCGKSTLVHLLLGLFQPASGVIRFDGRDLKSLPIRELRRSIGFVPQAPHLFEGSIRENIALTRTDASLDDVIEAAKVACIHEDIQAMFGGYDTRVTQRGESLSGGQRQRIALARALLCRPRVLILDEATSALDAVTEARVVRNLRQLRCTRVIIAHRLSTIADADAIVSMRNGEIVEMGSHGELVSRPSYYRELLAAQLRTEEPRALA